MIIRKKYFLSLAVALAIGSSATAVQPNVIFESTGISSHYSERNNFQKKKQFAIKQGNYAATARHEIFSKANSYDARLGVAPFMWANENFIYQNNRLERLPLKHHTQLSVEEVASDYIYSLYPELLIASDNSDAFSKAEGNIAQLRYMSTLSTGAKILKYDQYIGGQAVYGHEFNVLLNAGNQVVASSGYFSDSKKITNQQQLSKTSTSNNSVSIEQAIQFAIADIVGAPLYVDVLKKHSQLNVQKATADIDTSGFEYYKIANQLGLVSIEDDIRVRKVWFDDRQSLVSGYYIETLGKALDTNNQFGFAHLISESGELLQRNNLVSHQAYTYKVFTDNPSNKRLLDGPQGHEWPIVGTDPQSVNTNFMRSVQSSAYQNVTLESGPISTNDPWLPDAAVRTEGNNVFAYLDLDDVNGYQESGLDLTAELTNAFTFDYAFDANGTANSNVRKAAVVNLFYMNNWLHDWFYDSGFDEAAGNAQVDNFGRGGLGNDILLAEGQDSSGRNNANMSTPSDGGRPRMQMFLYDGVSSQGTSHDLMLTTVAGFENPIIALASFGPQVFAPLSGNVVAYTDAVSAPSITDACEPASNAAELTGNIALLDRGDCNFTVKVKNAQNAGAIAVLVANNIDQNQVSSMGGDDPTLTIPSVMISQNAGAALRSALETNTVSASMYRNAVTDVDGTFDNAIIAHEWGHYLSNRLIANAGGLNNQQGRGMGEGWSDFLALLTFVHEEDTLVAGNENYQALYPMFGWADQNAYFGIRRVPYSTNMEQNALTFKHIENGNPLPTTHPVQFDQAGTNSSAVHSTGNVWATMLWDIYAGLLNDSRYTFAAAQTLMKEYLVASLKMTPASPTLTEARDALLSVARASSEEDFMLMLNVFAKRGMGTGAIAPSRDSSSNSGVVESNATNLLAYGYVGSEFDTATGFCTDDNVLDAGETAKLLVSIRNTGFDTLVDVAINVSTSADVTIENNGLMTIASLASGDSIELPFDITLNTAQTAERIEFDISFPQLAGATAPANVSESLVVNHSFAPQVGRLSEDMENQALVFNDWTLDINAAQTTNVSAAEAAVDILTQPNGLMSSALFIADLGSQSDISFVSPELEIGANGFSFSFEHFFNFEEGQWDGAVLEVSANGGAWQDVTQAGGTFVSAGYNGVIETNPDSPITGRNAFVNTQAAATEAVDFGNALNNSTVKVRFRVGSDASVGGYGWEFDNVSFTGITNNPFSQITAETQFCDGSNQAPIATVVNANVNVNEREEVTLDASNSTDPENNSLSYTWVQTSGDVVQLDNSNSSIVTFTAPDVAQATTLDFEVTVSDGQLDSKASVQVNIATVNRAPDAVVSNSNITVNEGNQVNLNASPSSDPDQDALTYAWVQTSGASVSISNASSAQANFTAPEVSANTSLGFEVTVSDGDLDSKATVTVSVLNQTVVTPPPPPSNDNNSGGGGGSLGWLGLLLLLGIRGQRMRMREE